MNSNNTSGLVEKEHLSVLLRKLIVDADDFFQTQHKLLKHSYQELSLRIDHLRSKAMLTVSPTTTGTSNMMMGDGNSAGHMHAALNGNGMSAFSDLLTASVTPLRTTKAAPYSTGQLCSGASGFNGSVSGSAFLEDAVHAAAANGISTPPSKQLMMGAEGGKSPSMSLEDRLGGDWASLSMAKNQHQPHDTSSLMASPQAIGKLSLDELLSRFNTNTDASVPNFNFDSLYDQLTENTTPRVENPDALRSNTAALNSHAQDGGGGLTQHHIDPLSSLREKDVIPIDTLRSLHDQHLTTSVRAMYSGGRPKVAPIPGGAADNPLLLGIDCQSSCQVLVEFKRKRVLQYESNTYVAPGSYVMVGGDRGEDLGLAIYTWCEVKKSTRSSDSPPGSSTSTNNKENSSTSSSPRSGKTSVVGIGLSGSALTRSIGVGIGTVLRLATEDDVEQMHGTQAELESRAIDVCAQRVLDHALPMVIVDAEYQFDKKKLTFFYEAQQRMDFRELVRDLYKTFRARIWMELVDV